MSQEDVIELGKEVAAMKRDITNLQGWQKTQNGTMNRMDGKIDRLDSKIDKLVYWIMGEMAAVVLLAASVWMSGR